MCGIAGAYEYRTGAPVAPGVLAAMLATLWHRGPDDEGAVLDHNLAIGSRRLSIIDVAGGRQPLWSENGQVAVVCNGEIYNHLELRERLERTGHVFRTRSDCEVIVHLYEERGAACVDELRGMFALAVWDAARRTLLLARDRLGIKPLYYMDDGERLVFASEIKALLRYPGVAARLDLEALSCFLALKYVPAPRTMFAGIAALPPGYLLVGGPDGVSTRQYWDLSFQPARPELSEASAAEQLEALLRDAVRSHLMSDVPFGAFLSGGVDSSTVVALMSQTLSQPVKTFSVGFEGDGAALSELPYARLVAQRYQTDHHEVMVGPRDLLDNAETILWHLDQPIADEAALGNLLVARLAARHVKMVLTGEGGDELFAGYARYAGEQLAPLTRRIPAPLRTLALRGAQRLPGLRRPKIALFALAQADEVSRLASWFPLFQRPARQALLARQLQLELDVDAAERVFAEQLQRTDARDVLSRMLYVDTKLWLPDDLLARGDKMSMAASLEARVPLLDHPLVEFAASLPPHFKVRRLTRKYLLKKVSRAWLPAEVIERKKQGFPMPLSIWFRREARAFVHDLLAPDVLRRRGLFEPAFVEHLLREHESGFADHGSLIWSLLSIELWHRLFIDQPGGGRPPALPLAPLGARRGQE